MVAPLTSAWYGESSAVFNYFSDGIKCLFIHYFSRFARLRNAMITYIAPFVHGNDTTLFIDICTLSLVPSSVLSRVHLGRTNYTLACLIVVLAAAQTTPNSQYPNSALNSTSQRPYASPHFFPTPDLHLLTLIDIRLAQMRTL